MSFFERDLKKEQELGKYLDTIYDSLNLTFERIDNKDLQHQGVDLIYKQKKQVYYIDEKAQLDYINSDLPTFTFELSYLKNQQNKLGWLLDNTKITTHYFLITNIQANDKSTLSKGFKTCKITSVNRKKLRGYLDDIGLTEGKLNNYQEEIRKTSKKQKKIPIDALNIKTEGCLFYSEQLAEKPINLQLRLAFLIKKGIARRIYPTI